MWLSRFCFVAVLFVAVKANLKWLGMYQIPASPWTPGSVCLKRYGLSKRQTQFCNSHFSYMEYTQKAATESQVECRDILRERQWNCQSVGKAPKFEDDIKKDTRESAFLHSLSASSLALSIARGCMAGTISQCNCEHTKRQQSFPTEMVDMTNLTNVDNLLGCKGVTRVGVNYARMFNKLGFRFKAKSVEQMKSMVVRKHNIEVGLEELAAGEEISCVCNGATAGCVAKYCHRRLKQFSAVAQTLLRKYNKAVEAELTVEPQEKEDGQISTTQIIDRQKSDLVFLDGGPDHCEVVNGHHKSSRRQCVLDQTQTNSCSKLCCGKGYQERLIEIVSKCKCKFVYCCKVVCDTCTSVKKVFECL